MAGALAGLAPADRGPGTVVVANADDPMVVWAALPAPEVRWVGAGQVWHDDAVGCPACGGRIAFADDGAWACDRCAFARPDRDAWLDGDDLVLADGVRHRIGLALPGRFNRANAAMVAVAALPLLAAAGRPTGLTAVLDRLSGVTEVAGRFATVAVGGRPVHMLLAKNPAGWTAIFDLLEETSAPGTAVVCSVNARTADGLDTSWLWDVPFERLAGRPVVATGDRRLDVGVRLRYAEVPHAVVADPRDALLHALAGPGADDGVECLANYTAFADLRRRL